MNTRADIVEVIKIRPFLFLWLGQVTSQIAINMLTYVLAIRVYQATGSNTQVSILVLSIAIPALLFGMLAGVYVDRWEKKLVLVYCNVLRMIAVLGFFLSSETLLWVVVLAVFMSTVTQFFVPAEAPTIPVLVPQKLVLTANSLFTFTFYGSVIIGYILAGPALRIFGPKNVFIFISVIFFLASVFVRYLPGSSARKAFLNFIKRAFVKAQRVNHIQLDVQIGRVVRVKNELLQGYSFIRSHEKVLTAIILLVAAQASVAVLGALAPGFADKVLAIDVEDSSILLLAPAAIGLILGALFVGQYGRRWGKGKLINAGIILGGASLLALSFTNSLGVGVILMFSMGVANALIDVTCNTILQMETAEELRSRVYGVLTALVGGVSILPVMLAGVLSDVLGVSRVMFFISVLILSGWFYRLRKLRYN